MSNELIGLRYQNQEYKKTEKIFTTRITTHHDDMANLHRKLFKANCQVDSHKKQITGLNAKTEELELDLSKIKMTVEKFEMAFNKLNGFIGSQIVVKQKRGIGYDFIAVQPPFNDNYTSLPF